MSDLLINMLSLFSALPPPPYEDSARTKVKESVRRHLQVGLSE